MIAIGYGLEIILIAVILNLFNIESLILSIVIIVFVCGISSLKEFPDNRFLFYKV